MARVTVVEDDAAIAELVQLYLAHAGHDVVTFSEGLVALQALEADTACDVVVLDLMLPGLDGRGIARRLREHSSVPILMLTALDDDRDKLEGFRLGADDYLTKPFNPAELVARVEALLRRAGRSIPDLPPAAHRDLAAGNVRLDLDAKLITVDSHELELRPRERELLEVLIANQGIALSRDQLLERVWSDSLDGDSRTVDMHISRLRDRLAAAGASLRIETVRRIGYRLRAGEQPPPPS